MPAPNKQFAKWGAAYPNSGAADNLLCIDETVVSPAFPKPL